MAAYSGTFGVRQAERLLWRAGFGPSPGHAEALAAMGLHRAVASLTRPGGAAVLTGAEPVDDDGNPLAPADVWGHDHLWWLDRMVRTNQPLVERMTLVWHDWFATSLEGVSQQQLMLDQNALFRSSALGSFRQLALDVTSNPAMIIWLNLNENRLGRPNENYARELMELFTLGADRGAYSESDVRQAARALTGWAYDWSSQLGAHNFRYVASRHDPGTKTIFGQTGAFTWEQAVSLCVSNALHPSFFVQKLWSYFIPVPAVRRGAHRPGAGVRGRRATRCGRCSRRSSSTRSCTRVRGWSSRRWCSWPGMLRALRQAIDTEDWWWLCQTAGQRLFLPPDVAGWDHERWLDSGTVRGRWLIVEQVLRSRYIQGAAYTQYDADRDRSAGAWPRRSASGATRT